uniref:Uncharacterized protein n=1 Tax=Mycena chlorophos TaxID=658473 RepID=A0ABQ0M458_MYCCL|nr:predicted protein [Mycena chlorophos]
MDVHAEIILGCLNIFIIETTTIPLADITGAEDLLLHVRAPALRQLCIPERDYADVMDIGLIKALGCNLEKLQLASGSPPDYST